VVYIKELIMAMHTRHSTLKSAGKPRAGRKALLVLEVGLAIILTGALFAVVERNLSPIGAQAAPVGTQTLQRGTPGAKIERATGDSLPREAWYTPAQYLNQATEAEVLPSQF
jgi:hypothetical protein